jgi:hypothetical protein
MPLVSLTRLRLRGFRYLLQFGWQSHRISRQAEHAPGFVAGQVYADPLRLTFWTVTVWENEAAMRGFRASGAHQAVMPRLGHWCDEASVAHWNQPGSKVPETSIALRRMQAEGRPLRVRFPSPDHAAGRIAADNRAPVRGTQLSPTGTRHGG